MSQDLNQALIEREFPGAYHRRPSSLFSTADVYRLLDAARAEGAPAAEGARQLPADLEGVKARLKRLASIGGLGYEAHDTLREVIAQLDALSPPAAEGKEDVRSVRQWLLGLHGLDMDEIAADGGITVGMVVQQEAVEMARRLARYLSHTPAPAAEPVGDWVMVPREPTEAMIDAAKVSFADDGPIAFANFYCAMVAASPPPEPVAISREEWCRLIHEQLVGGDADELIHHPAQKSWETPTKHRWEQWMELADAILSKLSGYPLVEGKQGVMASSAGVCGEGTLPSPSEPPRSAGGELFPLLASAWFYGGWKAETHNERRMQDIMTREGWWPIESEAALIAKIDGEKP